MLALAARPQKYRRIAKMNNQNKNQNNNQKQNQNNNQNKNQNNQNRYE